MLNEMIIKREKMKTSDIQKGMQMSLIRLSPWTVLLKDLLTELRNLDSQEIFRRAVTDKEAPMYSKIIDFPMDLGTMEKKVENFKYKCFAEFEYDVDLIAKNCQHYNAPSTVFYKWGKDFQQKSTPILKQARKVAENYNTRTGKYRGLKIRNETFFLTPNVFSQIEE